MKSMPDMIMKAHDTRRISREKFIPHLLRYKDIADELSDLERDCHISYNMFMV